MIDFFRDLIKIRLSEERIRHTIGVEEVVKELAPKYGIDIQAAQIAAITHDMAKNLSLEDQIKKAQKWELVYYSEDLTSPQALHGRIAAYILENEYNLKDTDILNAVANHTLGRPKMSPLEMLIYSADLIEPGRSFPGVDKLRQKLYDDLVEGTFSCAKHTLHYLKEDGKNIHPLTLQTYQDLTQKIKK